MCNILWTLGGNLIKPIGDLYLMATVFNYAIQPIATGAFTLAASHAQHIELADEITENDWAVAGMHQGTTN